MSAEPALAVAVERLPSTESGDGRAFVDPDMLARARIPAGGVVELRTHRGRRLLARAAPQDDDRGLGIVRLDRYQMRFLKPDLHEAIAITPVDVAESKRLVLEPLAPMPEDLNAVERDIARPLCTRVGRPSPGRDRVRSSTLSPQMFNLAAALLDRHLEAGRGERPAIRYEGSTISYGELAAMTARVGGALRELGVEREQRVAIVLLDRPEFVATFLGAVRIGAVAVPLSTLLRAPDLAELIAHSGAVALVIEASILDAVRPHLPALERLRLVVVGGAAPDALSFDTLCAAAPDELVAADTRPGDMCFWQYTSGTTGRPKGIVHRQADLAFVTERYGRAVIGMTEDDRSFSVAKLFFSYGLANSLAFPLAYGASVVLHPGRADPRSVLDVVARERPTLFYGVPTAYAALLSVAEAEPERADLSSVRLCISAGESLPAPLFERWKARFGHEILDGIGSTEIGYIFISNVPGRVRPGTSGLVVPGYEAKVVDAQGETVPPGEIGDLWVRGASTFSEYWNDSERTARTIRDGWVVTGDKYSVDADGYFRYAGRADDMLKVGGIWVAPAVVEAAVAAHPSVLECAVVGHPDPDGLIKPAAFVVLRSGAHTTEDEIVSFVTERIAPFMRPRWVHFVAELPKTSTGKIQRYKLREMTEGARSAMHEVRT